MLNLPFLRRWRTKPHRYNHSRASFPIDWVLPRTLAVGRLPQAVDGDTLAQADIQAVLALCSESEGPWPNGLEHRFYCRRIVIPDSHYTTALTSHHIEAAVDHLHACIECRLPVFVHCLAGIERSPIICTAYLCKHQNYSLWESLNWVKQVHPDSLPTEQQIQSIRDYLNDCARTVA
jgi:hypothetical protein